jgi:hypothetical protein
VRSRTQQSLNFKIKQEKLVKKYANITNKRKIVCEWKKEEGR